MVAAEPGSSEPATAHTVLQSRGYFSESIASLPQRRGQGHHGKEWYRQRGVDRPPVDHDACSSAAEAREDSWYPPNAVLPKVFASQTSDSHHPPRQILVERKRRHFAKQDVRALLEHLGIDLANDDFFASALPLDTFDDEMFDERTPEEWIGLGRDPHTGKMHFVPAKALKTEAASSMHDQAVPTSRRYEMCRVYSYDPTARLFEIAFEDSLGRRERVPRIELMFLAEDPENYAHRVARAHLDRHNAELHIEYNLYVDSMPIAGMDGVDKGTETRIVAKTLRTPGLRKGQTNLSGPLAEMHREYCRTLNALTLRHLWRDPAARKTFEFIELPPAAASPPVPLRGVPDPLYYDFAERFKRFQFATFLTTPEVIHTIAKVRAECNKMLEAPIFNTAIQKTVSLEEFEQLQATICSGLVQVVRGSWVQSVKNHVKNSLKTVGKGWLNLNETSRDAYEISKLKRLIAVVMFTMEDTVRDMAIQSLEKLQSFFEWACPRSVEVISLANIKVNGAQRGPLLATTVQWDADAEANCSQDDESTSPRTKSASEETQADTRAGDEERETDMREAQVSALTRSAPSSANDVTPPAPADGPDIPPNGGRQVHGRRGAFRFGLTAQGLQQSLQTMIERGLAALRNVPQIEPLVMTGLFWSGTPVLPSVSDSEKWVQTIKHAILDTVQRGVQPLRELETAFASFASTLRVPAERAAEPYVKRENVSLEDCIQAVYKARRAAENAADEIPSTVNIGMITVNCSHVRAHLVARHNEVASLIETSLVQRARECAHEILVGYKAVIKRLVQVPRDAQEAATLREYLCSSLADEIKPYESQLETLRDLLAAVETLQTPLSDEDSQLHWLACAMPQNVTSSQAQAERSLAEHERKFSDILKREQEQFDDDVLRISDDAGSLIKFTDRNDLPKAYAAVKALRARLDSAQARAQAFSVQEGLLVIENRVDYAGKFQFVRQFETYETLWSAAEGWRTVTARLHSEPLHDIDASQISRDLDTYARGALKASRTLGNSDTTVEIAKIGQAVSEEIDHFRPNAELLAALRTPGMRERHWEMIQGATSLQLQPGEAPGFFEALTQGVQEHASKIIQICDTASKEYSIEITLDNMETAWEEVELQVVPYKESGTFVVRGTDEIGQLLDDHIVMAQSMVFSPFKAPFIDRIERWENRLKLTQEVLEEWLECQRNWLYLEPIFSSEDILMQLPTEGKKFNAVDRTWRGAMRSANEAGGVFAFCDSPKRLLQFREANQVFDEVQKGLADYLETKRQAFARFYFLSNDELLQILSQTRDPRAVQPHLKKAFENIASLEFVEAEQEQSSTAASAATTSPETTSSAAVLPRIAAMYSGEDERVPFVEPIVPYGNVEHWLGNVEKAMKQSVRAQINMAVRDYTVTPRAAWVLRWPGQVVLCGSQTYWTQECADAIRSGGSRALSTYADVCQTQLHSLTQTVRGDLTKLQRLTLGALITIDVHARDVVHRMVEAGVESEHDFDWIAQMRYYVTPTDENDADCFVRQVESEFLYGNEYLGNTMRLVITPLTDRIYLTLTGALSMSLGGAPQGPAGTGKTETTKDLAKALAKQCVVFNCQEGLDYIAMGKFFKGLAMAGAWACFDEFNRIDVEVLSVIAQQMIQIQQACLSRATRFVFEGAEISLDPTYAVFITMNPGYAGRTELPDNLKALFRPVACMVPDYALIAEIRLYSFGFANARNLAQKMVATFRLSSEQLSSQYHYDFGMRAVNTVIIAAGNLKREYPDDDEEILLLRALRDSNIPKFLGDDIVLFNGIISDLFPGVVQPSSDVAALEAGISSSLTGQGLQPVREFIGKTLQLYETTVLRHGLMLVGPTGGGKTTALRVLANAMSELADAGKSFPRVRTMVCNPKAVTLGQLYGEFDEATHEWTDGILCALFRSAADDTSPDHKWLVFDGPVDAVWIESMNTVLDDNKKLCLISGEIIKMSSTMRVIFEVDDLSQASPATVSRCGMIYLDPELCIGIEARVERWLRHLPPDATAYAERLRRLALAFLSPLLTALLDSIREFVASPKNTLVESFFRLASALLADLSATAPTDNGDALASPQDSTSPRPTALSSGQENALDATIVFALTWSVAGTSDNDGRRLADQEIRRVAASESVASWLWPGSLPDDPVHDVYFDAKSLSWRPWQPSPDILPPVDLSVGFTNIVVPNTDTARYGFLIDRLLSNKAHVLALGPTGTGKTLIVKQSLESSDALAVPCANQQLSWRESALAMPITFSAQTSANVTQDQLEARLEKRRKGVLGPPVGKTLYVFVDDLNMPTREQYGAQPPIELLRQWLDHGGWYDRRTQHLVEIADVVLVAAMGPPGGGRNPVSARMLRHFHTIAFPELSEESTRVIFSSILSSWLQKHFDDAALVDMHAHVVSATLAVYTAAQGHLLPTPAHSHYTFNLRDLGKVFQGIIGASPNRICSPGDLCELWAHECARVFRDRLVDDGDRTWLDEQLADAASEFMHVTLDSASLQRIFCDFMVPTAVVPEYAATESLAEVNRVVSEYLEDYNTSSGSPMPLVLFEDAVRHVARIVRVLRQRGGNMLLLGVGGSGRQSLARLSAFVCEYRCVQVEIAKGYGVSEWRDDVKTLLRSAGQDGADTMFLFTDTQIVRESLLEDINNILNSGMVPNLFDAGEEEQIMAALRPVAQAEGRSLTKAALLALFAERVQRHLHVVLCMSPVGDAFRQRLRMFPSLVNCCTIDWFAPWPEDALRSVCTEKLASAVLGDIGVAPLGEVCAGMHGTVAVASERYRREMRRHNYVTPTSYLELLSLFTMLLKRTRGSLAESKRRLQIGLEKLRDTEGQVKGLERELTDMQPKLEQTAVEVDRMMEQIQTDKEDASRTRENVAKQEEDASAKAAECKEIKEDAERDLAEALPALDEAVEVLSNLKTSDISEVGKYSTPPQLVVTVLEPVCIMLGIAPKKVGEVGKKVDSYWEPAKKMLGDPKGLMTALLEFDKDNIPEKTIAKIQPYVEMEDFTPKKVAMVSKACTAMCQWVLAMNKYYHVARNVAPKRARLEEAERGLAESESSLAAAQQSLAAVESRIAGLEGKYQESVQRKDELVRKVRECSVKIDRAQRLIGGLGGEKTRWLEQVAELESREHCVVGDALIAAASIAYLGAFTSDFRSHLVHEWQELLARVGIEASPSASVSSVLLDPVEVRSWEIHGLPSDDFSVENAVVLRHGRRWPLLIDPQGQANKWVKTMERENGLHVAKLSDKDFLRTLENAIRFGQPVLLENVGETLDPALEPVLLQQTFVQNGSVSIRLGDNVIPYHEDFRLYITTKLSNPHYSPELAVKVTLLNFTVTPSGLEDQLLASVVARERPDLEQQKNELTVSNAQMKRQLNEIEEKILQLLSEAQGDILNDEELINTLAHSKVTSEDIKAKVAAAEATEHEIDATREKYRPVAARASTLFFAVADLATVDPMYQYSLYWFAALFTRSIDAAEQSPELDARIAILNETFTQMLYANVCRSLFEKDKLMFSFLICARILQAAGRIDPAEWRFLLSGAVAAELRHPNPAPAWLPDAAWALIDTLGRMPSFQGIADDVRADTEAWRALFDSATPESDMLPGRWATLSLFRKLVVVRCLRPDKTVPCIQGFITHYLGRNFVESPPLSLDAAFDDSSPTTPLLFVLSPGSDPAGELFRFAEARGMGRRLEQISLGQGQGPKAAAMVRSGATRGSWILLQNCHLAASWMPALEAIVEQLDPDTTHRDFRLWLTSMPSAAFPVSILQNGVKMTNEPPRGLKATLQRCYADLSDDMFERNAKSDAFRQLLYAQSFLHAVIMERRKFGPLGWNIAYEFTQQDMQCCVTMIDHFLNMYDVIPFDVLQFIGGHVHYGGRVTDDWDRRCLMTLVREFIAAQVLEDCHALAPVRGYDMPAIGKHADYLTFIGKLPINAIPEVVGLHENANITSAQNESLALLSTVLNLEPREGSSGRGSSGSSAATQTREDVIQETARAVKNRVTQVMDEGVVAAKYPVLYEQSMNTVLQQEVVRYNRLLRTIHRTLDELSKGLAGLVVMSADLEGMADALFSNRVPAEWARFAYPSLKPLASWVEDLVKRLAFIQAWIDDGPPASFWISGLFFPQAFLTGTLQNFARKHTVSIDRLSFSFDILQDSDGGSSEAPEEVRSVSFAAKSSGISPSSRNVAVRSACCACTPDGAPNTLLRAVLHHPAR